MKNFENQNSFRLDKRREQSLGTLASGEVVFDRPKSHLHNNDRNFRRYLSLALEKIKSENKEFLIESIIFDNIIGINNCIPTSKTDTIVFAQREGRDGLTRFVKKRQGNATSSLTVVLKKVQNGYILITAFAGPKAPPEPWDKNATPESEDFWNTHALVWGTEPIIPDTEVDDAK